MLENIAKMIRLKIIETSHSAHVPHVGSCLSSVDILVALYWNILQISPASAYCQDRDRFILSKGHGAPALFQILGERGFFDRSLFERFGQNGSLIGEHPLAHGVAGIEAATGSLGHGLPIAAGLALGARMQHLNNFVYVLMSDGECNEGSVWEAALFARAQRLNNLVVIIDFNKWQATGRSEEVMALSPFMEKWQAFGWDTAEVDGHNIREMTCILQTWRQADDHLPHALIAHTVKGKGVSFMEDDNNWHYKIPTEQEVQAARRELAITEDYYA